MKIGKKLFCQLTNLSMSVPVSRQRIQDVLSKQIEELNVGLRV